MISTARMRSPRWLLPGEASWVELSRWECAAALQEACCLLLCLSSLLVPRLPSLLLALLAAGLLSLPQEDMHRRARQENPRIQQQWADDFRKQFDPYDWTKMLE